MPDPTRNMLRVNEGIYERTPCPEPRVMRFRSGKFCALTPAPLRPGIGVEGDTEDEAIANFRVRWERWQDLLSQGSFVR